MIGTHYVVAPRGGFFLCAQSPTTTRVITTLITSEMVVLPSPVVDDPRYDPVSTLIRGRNEGRLRPPGGRNGPLRGYDHFACDEGRNDRS